MKKNNDRLIGLTVLAVVALYILAKSSLLDPFWSRVLTTIAALVTVGAIAYLVLRWNANVSILSGSQRELESRSQQVTSVNLLGGTKLYLGSGNEEVVVDTSFVNILGGSDLFLPAGWRVEDHSLKLLAGITDKRSAHVTGSGPTIRITGFMLLGGVTIRESPQMVTSMGS
ncbi:MAG: hypothetical protein ACLRX6_07955 [Limosilactobacillus pontis]|uniref:Cell wall-active antibiotics response LiaF-like C-terminal domain-containing protein n=1 Tax=Limosilactobacillus pontis TaxID=35787 RepID=A0A2J6NKM5_9LACO|nr:hypothetical protein [Limosilactobacillus pontis]PMB81897.1 hypothetical protein CK797_08665 [Limosilactobacillus pontis]